MDEPIYRSDTPRGVASSSTLRRIDPRSPEGMKIVAEIQRELARRKSETAVPVCAVRKREEEKEETMGFTKKDVLSVLSDEWTPVGAVAEQIGAAISSLNSPLGVLLRQGQVERRLTKGGAEYRLFNEAQVESVTPLTTVADRPPLTAMAPVRPRCARSLPPGREVRQEIQDGLVVRWTSCRVVIEDDSYSVWFDESALRLLIQTLTEAAEAQATEPEEAA
jgi:hypothetical protein